MLMRGWSRISCGKRRQRDTSFHKTAWGLKILGGATLSSNPQLLILLSRNIYIVNWRIFTITNEVWGNVMFLQVFVCPQGEWLCVVKGDCGLDPEADTPLDPEADTAPQPRGRHPHSRHGHWNRQYISYWNEFLLRLNLSLANLD